MRLRQASNGQRDYDITNPATVQSSCAGFGLGAGSGGDGRPMPSVWPFLYY